MRELPGSLVARSLAFALAAAALPGGPARADPLDLDVFKLGSPSAQAIAAAAGRTTPNPTDLQMAAYARQRFALMASELGLALSSFILSPPVTTGYDGFDFDLEFAYAPTNADAVGGQSYWPTRGPIPRQLLMPALHVRKALPFSTELGARIIYINQSFMFAAQGELKIALVEGFYYVPDVAVRGAMTHLYGARGLDLTTTDLDLMVGKKFGVGGVMTLTPYVAVRFTWLDAASEAMDFAPAAGDPGPVGVIASFPTLQRHDHVFTRFALGVRLHTYAVSLSAEVTRFGGKDFAGLAPGQLGPQDLPAYSVKSSWSGAARLGFEF